MKDIWTSEDDIWAPEHHVEALSWILLSHGELGRESFASRMGEDDAWLESMPMHFRYPLAEFFLDDEEFELLVSAAELCHSGDEDEAAAGLERLTSLYNDQRRIFRARWSPLSQYLIAYPRNYWGYTWEWTPRSDTEPLPEPPIWQFDVEPTTAKDEWWRYDDKAWAEWEAYMRQEGPLGFGSGIAQMSGHYVSGGRERAWHDIVAGSLAIVLLDPERDWISLLDMRLHKYGNLTTYEGELLREVRKEIERVLLEGETWDEHSGNVERDKGPRGQRGVIIGSHQRLDSRTLDSLEVASKSQIAVWNYANLRAADSAPQTFHQVDLAMDLEAAIAEVNPDPQTLQMTISYAVEENEYGKRIRSYELQKRFGMSSSAAVRQRVHRLCEKLRGTLGKSYLSDASADKYRWGSQHMPRGFGLTRVGKGHMAWSTRPPLDRALGDKADFDRGGLLMLPWAPYDDEELNKQYRKANNVRYRIE